MSTACQLRAWVVHSATCRPSAQPQSSRPPLVVIKTEPDSGSVDEGAHANMQVDPIVSTALPGGLARDTADQFSVPQPSYVSFPARPSDAVGPSSIAMATTPADTSIAVRGPSAELRESPMMIPMAAVSIVQSVRLNTFCCNDPHTSLAAVAPAALWPHPTQPAITAHLSTAILRTVGSVVATRAARSTLSEPNRRGGAGRGACRWLSA